MGKITGKQKMFINNSLFEYITVNIINSIFYNNYHLLNDMYNFVILFKFIVWSCGGAAILNSLLVSMPLAIVGLFLNFCQN